MSSGHQQPDIGFPTRFFYGFGSIAFGVKDVAFRSYLLLFYNQVVGISAGIVSAAIMAALVIDAIIDPLVGQFSDNLRTKLGRRHPMMYAASLPAAFSFLLLWSPPDGLSDGAMFLYILATASLMRVSITFYEIPSSALGPELSDKYDERTKIASYRYFFGYLGGLGMSFAALYVFLRPTAEYPIGQLNPAGYTTFAVVGAIVILASILISTLGTQHRVKYLRRLPPAERKSFGESLKEMRETFSHKGFLAILAFGVLKYTAIGSSAALALYFGTFFWGFSSRELAILTLEGIAGAFLSMFVAPIMSGWMGKRNAAFVLAVVGVIFAVSPFALRFLGMFYANGDPALLPAIFITQGIYATCGIASAVLVAAMIGDVVDDSALRTGRRSEGLFFAANSFMQQCVTGLGILVAGVLLSIVHFPEGARPGEVDPSIIETLAWLYIPSIAGLYIVGASFLYFYRIDRAAHDANIQRIRERESGAPTLGDVLREEEVGGAPITPPDPAPSKP